MTGSYYIGEKELLHSRNRNPSERRCVVEIPEDLFHAVNKFRRWLPRNKQHVVTFSEAMTRTLQAWDAGMEV
jgi:hypothetical protein